MRARYDENGNISSYHRVVFESIPDDYEMKTILTGDKFSDLSYVGIMKHLRTEKVEDFSDPQIYSAEVLSHMAMDYIMSARYLYDVIVNDRDGETVSYYTIPCAFACKHSIELKLKECQIVKGTKSLSGHSVIKIWNDLDEKSIPHADDIKNFLEEVEKIDNNEMALRYGVSKNMNPLQEEYKFNIDSLISNTMFLFNVLDEYVIDKYRYKV
ncbi:MAG: hypothetical protein K6A70_04170 [Erysipelotrichaceae bacterium]|nr:hypothetical protein [Erysipelotrichaceae bacterium]